MSLSARLRVYAPDGAPVGFLTEPASWSASLPISDVSALTMHYAVSARGADLLASACEVAVEVNSGAGWVEPRNARYRRLEVSADSAKGAADVESYTLPGYAGIMDGIVIIPATYGPAASYDQDGKRKFLSASVGQILASVLLEARGLVSNLAPGLTLGFSPTKDSAGADWATRVTIYYEAGLSLLSILDNLAQQGQCDWWMEGRTLRVVNPESTAAHTGVRLMGDASERPVRASLAGLLHTAFLVGDDKTWRVDNPGAPTPWGASMRVLTQGGVRDEGTARSLIQAELDAGSAERVEYTWAAPVIGNRDLPLVAYQPGDYVQAPNRSGQWEEMRVYQATLAWDAKGLEANLTLNDRFVDAQVRNAKRTKGIVNGASGDAGTGALPSVPARAVPQAPAGIVASSEGYWQGDSARSSVRVSWAPVEQDTQGMAVSIAKYVLRVGGRSQDVSSGTSGGLDDLGPGTTVRIDVAAISTDGVQSAWASTSIMTEWPLEKLDPPTQLTATSENGIVTVSWDGQLKGAGQPYIPPQRFGRVDVHEAEAPGGPWALVGTIRAGMLVLDRQSMVGQTRYLRGLAVDVLGASSDAGPASSVVVTSEVSQEVAAARQKADDALAQLAGTQSSTLGQKVASAVTATRDEYALGAESSAPTSGWATTPPARTPGAFIWVRTTVTYGDGTTSTGPAVLVTGNAGSPGASGRGIASTTVEYQAGSSGTAVPGGPWSSTIPAVTADEFLWTRTTLAYTDATTSIGYSVGAPGAPGDPGVDGRGVQSTQVDYQAAASGTDVPTGSWSAQVPSVAAGQFLWSRTVVIYTDGTSSTSYAIGKMGQQGDTGVSVSSVTTYYRTVATGSDTPAKPTASPAPSPWTTTEPGFLASVELYRTDRILYSNGAFAYTDVSKVSAYTAAVQAMSAASAAQTTANGLNARITSQSAPTTRLNGTPLGGGDEWWVANESVQIVGIRMWNGSAWLPYSIVGDSVIVPSTIGTVSLADGAVTAPNLFVDQAMIDALAVESMWAGKITTQMFSTQAAFSGPGVLIDRTGVDIVGSGSAGIFLDATNGLVGKDSTGAQTFRVAMDGSVTLRGSLTSGSTITGSTIAGSTITGGRVQSAGDGKSRAVLTNTSAGGGGVFIDSNQGWTLAQLSVDSDTSNNPSLRFYDAASGSIGPLRTLFDATGLSFLHPTTGNTTFRISFGTDNEPIMRFNGSDTGNRLGYLYRTADDPGLQIWGGSDSRSWAHIDILASSDNQPRFRSTASYSRTTTSNANVYVASDGTIARSTSLKAGKVDVQDQPGNAGLLGVSYRSWIDRQALVDAVLGEAPVPTHRVVGAVAEEMEQVAPELCTYGPDGLLTGIAYDRVAIALIPLLRGLTNRVEMLEGAAATSWPQSPTYDDEALVDGITSYGAVPAKELAPAGKEEGGPL